MRGVLIGGLVGLVAMGPGIAAGAEPMGFDGLTFGTPRAALVTAPAFRAHCHPAPETQAAVRTGTTRVSCRTYDLDGLGTRPVALLFTPGDALAGFVVFIPNDQLADARQHIEALYGPPTGSAERGRTLTWSWPSGTAASLTVYCRGTDTCFTVKADPSGTASPSKP